MDWLAVAAQIAAAYSGLSDGAGTTLRASHSVAPDAIVAPAAVTILRGFRDVSVMGARMTGTAAFDVLILLDPMGDMARRYAALLRFLPYAMEATLAHVQVAHTGTISGAVPGDVEVSPAGDSPDYAGMPFDLIRIPLDVTFAYPVTVAP